MAQGLILSGVGGAQPQVPASSELVDRALFNTARGEKSSKSSASAAHASLPSGTYLNGALTR